MKSLKALILNGLLLAIAFAIIGLGQSSITLSAGPPPPANPVSPYVTGRTGSTIYTYFVVTHYPVGTVVSNGQTIFNAPNTLSVSNFVTVSWNAVSGSTSFDLIRFSGQVPFTNSCNACLVVNGTTSTTGSDQGAALGSYTLAATAGNATANLYLNNRDYSTPVLVWAPQTVAPGNNAGLWNGMQNPTGNLSLTMGAFTSLFTYNAATGSSDLFKLIDTSGNTGTGALFRSSTAVGSAAMPFEADSNGVGWEVTNAGVLKGIGGAGNTASISTGTSGNTDLAGRITLSTGTGSYSFVNTYVGVPVCMFGDETTPANAITPTVTNTGFSLVGTGSDSIKYGCIGLN